MLQRKYYLDKIETFIDTDLIKVITGIRRSGKSVIMMQIIDILKGRGISSDNIIYLNIESRQNRKYKDPDNLYEYVMSKVNNNEKFYIFIDEVQMVNEFEDVINSFRVDFDSSIFITGSNANLLSGELATLLSGRYVKFNIFPFTYKEYCEYLKLDYYSEVVFSDFVMFGGLPSSFIVKETIEKQNIISDVADSIIYRDILLRIKSKDDSTIQKFIEYVLSQTGKVFSAPSIANYLKSEKINTTQATIYSYLDLMLNSRLISKCSRYDIRGKRKLKREEKYYVADLGLVNYSLHETKIDQGASIETIVYNQLRYLGYKVYIGKLKDLEVDFVADLNGIPNYLQVCLYLNSDKTIEREYRSLHAIKDNYPKYVISLDKGVCDREGIKHINLIDFLVGKVIL